MPKNKEGTKNHYKKKEMRHIVDVPKSYFQRCLKKANSREQKEELEEILKQCD